MKSAIEFNVDHLFPLSPLQVPDVAPHPRTVFSSSDPPGVSDPSDLYTTSFYEI